MTSFSGHHIDLGLVRVSSQDFFSPAEVPFRHQCAKPSARADTYQHPSGNRVPLRSTLYVNGTLLQYEKRSSISSMRLMNHFYIIQIAGCAVLFSKDVRVNSVYILDTRTWHQQVVKEGQSGWVLQAVISRASFWRIPCNGKSCFTMMSPTFTNNTPRIAESRKFCYLQSVL